MQKNAGSLATIEKNGIGSERVKCALLGCILVPSIKSLGQIGFEI